jgi:hypothetical protein
MTIVPVHHLDMNDLQILGNNTAEAIRLDHENLMAGNSDLDRWDQNFTEPTVDETEYDN